MPKFNIIEWIRARLRRQFNDEHIITVCIYDNGQRVCRLNRSVYGEGNDRIGYVEQLSAANSLVSTLYGEELRAKKLRLRGRLA